MAQIFIFGDSMAYGVGGEMGWADMLKHSLHTTMYGKDGIGETHEVYNFAQPGVGIEFPIVTAIEQLKFYNKGPEVIAIVQVGANNMKAKDKPDNFLLSIDEYESVMSQLIEKLQGHVKELVMVDTPLFDETKTNPKRNPFTGGLSYFTNDRMLLANHVLMKLCHKYNAHHIDLTVNPKEWAASYVSSDGLHPNQAGHQYIFEKIMPEVDKLLA